MNANCTEGKEEYEGGCMRDYNIIPEFRYSKFFPFSAIICQLGAIGFMVVGHLVTSVAFLLACIFQFCALYYAGLSIFNRYYRLNISSDSVTVWSIVNKPKQYRSDELRWRIGRIPWYNSYFILLYSTGRIPVAIVQPHWKNALRLIHFPHYGKLSSVELDYLEFLKSVGLIRKKGQFYVVTGALGSID